MTVAFPPRPALWIAIGPTGARKPSHPAGGRKPSHPTGGRKVSRPAGARTVRVTNQRRGHGRRTDDRGGGRGQPLRGPRSGTVPGRGRVRRVARSEERRVGEE